MIINKGHWNRSDSVNDDFLCCLHISVMKTSYHVLPSMLFTALWLKINPTDSSPNAPDRFECRPQLEVRRLKTMVSPTDLESVRLIQQIRECEKCANVYKIFFLMHLTFSSLCFLSIFLLIYIMFVNVYAFFLLHVGSLYLWHKSFFYVIIVSFSILIFVKKKRCPSWFQCLCQLCVQ